MTYKPI